MESKGAHVGIRARFANGFAGIYRTRSTANFDLLSKNRSERGIGKGRFFDAREMMVGRNSHPMKSDATITSTISSFRVRAISTSLLSLGADVSVGYLVDQFTDQYREQIFTVIT